MTTSGPTCSMQLTLADNLGLRPAALLVNVARRYDADVVVKHHQSSANGKSLLSVLTLLAPRGARLTVSANGGDAPKVIQAIRDTMARLFGDRSLVPPPLPAFELSEPAEPNAISCLARSPAAAPMNVQASAPGAPPAQAARPARNPETAVVRGAAAKAATPARTRQTFRWRLREHGAARDVCLAGPFNRWIPAPMEQEEGGFHAEVELAPGRYPYKFVVDGQWRTDPSAGESEPDGYGGVNSVVRVGPGPKAEEGSGHSPVILENNA